MNSLAIATKTSTTASLVKPFRGATLKTIVFVGTMVFGLFGLMTWSAYDLSQSLARERLQADVFRVNLLASEHLDRLQAALLRSDSTEKLVTLMYENERTLPFVKEIRLKDSSAPLWPTANAGDSPITEDRRRFNELVLLEQLAMGQQSMAVSVPQATFNNDAEIILGWLTKGGGAKEPIFARVSVLTLLNFAAEELGTQPKLRISQVEVLPSYSLQNRTAQSALRNNENRVKLVIAAGMLSAETQQPLQTFVNTSFQLLDSF